MKNLLRKILKYSLYSVIVLFSIILIIVMFGTPKPNTLKDDSVLIKYPCKIINPSKSGCSLLYESIALTDDDIKQIINQIKTIKSDNQLKKYFPFVDSKEFVITIFTSPSWASFKPSIEEWEKMPHQKEIEWMSNIKGSYFLSSKLKIESGEIGHTGKTFDGTVKYTSDNYKLLFKQNI